MGYCKKCGAYIPDGDTKCLACGYDEAAERQAQEKKNKSSRNTGSFAAEYAEEKKEMERRRRQREKERREYEARLRDKETQRRDYERQRREQQQENRRWAEEEYRRRSSGSSVRPAEKDGGRGNTVGEHRALSVLSYISFLFILPILLCPEDSYARYHARQGLALFIFSIISDIIASILPIGWLLGLFRIYCVFKGIGNAHTGKMEPLPYIGKYAER